MRIAPVALLAVLLVGCGTAESTATTHPTSAEASASASAPGPSVTATPRPQAEATASARVPSTPPSTKRDSAWNATQKMLTPHTYQTATLLPGGKVLVAGGQANPEDETASAAAELYDPATGKWTATDKMMQGRWDHTATLLRDGTVLVAGGQSGTNNQLASAELYDPDSGRWTATGSMHRVRSAHTATVLPDGRVLVAGGYDFKGAESANVEMLGLSAAELYDPGTGRWTPTGSTAEGQAGHTATLLQDGSVLVAGGIGTGDAELYQPATGRWTATGTMTQRRRDHTASLLPNGKVLVTGGFAGSGYTLDSGRPCSGPHEPCSAELYDPGTGRWTATGNMHADRIGHTATILPDGTVLVVGLGTVAAPVIAELYHPTSGRWTATANPAKTRGLTATLLLDGRVLATGDFTNDSRAAELYAPGVGT